MPGSFGFTPQSQQLAFDAIAIRTYLFDSSEGSGDGGDGDEDTNYTLLPSIRCEQVQYKEGVEPPTARFSYILDEVAAAANNWPSQFEDVWPIQGAVDPDYVVATDDELVVLALMPDDTTRVLFHGFARVPQTDISPDHQAVTFVAVGVAIKCWNTPIGGRYERNGDVPNSVSDDDQVWTDLPTRFNPAGTGTRVIGGYLPNCTPDNYDYQLNVEGNNSDEPLPLFLDPNIDRDPDPRTLWNLSKAVRYILAVWNNQDEDSVVANPDFGMLDALLQNRRPLDGQAYYDPSNPATYKTDPNVIRDYDATNKPWPEAVAQLLGFYGFGMRWVCEDDQNGEPDDYLDIYRKDASAPNEPKPVYLPATGSLITDAMANVAAMHAAFDFHGVANDVFIETALERFEISVILAPGFMPVAGDENNAGAAFRLTALDQSNAAADTRKKYRYYVADECADGHWSIENNEWVTDTPIDLSKVFDVAQNEDKPPDKNPGQEQPPSYVHRYRPGKNKLFSKDLLNLPRKAQLAVSRNYGGSGGGADPPVLWDTVSGTDWQTIDGGWSLLTDRLGIMVTAESPEEWQAGKPPSGAGGPWPVPDGKLRGIKGIANPNTDPSAPVGEQQFYLRLTTVIEGDFGIDVEAYRRDASPMKDTIIRRVDARDHFHYDVIDGTSAFSKSPLSADVVQDDTDLATSHACQLRSAHEFPPLTASITIPMFVTSYQVGDRINQIAGRNVSLQVNAGAEQAEAPSYPFIVAVTWDFTGEKQATILQLTDRRAEPRHP